MFGLGPMELTLIFGIVLLLFGAKRIPDLARSLGKASKEFKEAKSAFNDAVNDAENEAPKKRIAPPATEEAATKSSEKSEA